MRQVIIYTRFSPRPNASECESCEFQEKKAREYCALREWDVVQVYYDKAVSGSKRRRRGVDAAIAHCCQIRGILLVHKFDRLARSIIGLADICAILEKAGCELASVQDNVDTSTPTGRAMFWMIAIFAQLERENTSERTKEKMAQMKADGKPINGNPEFGYKRDPDNPEHIMPDKEEMETRLMMVALRREGRSLNQICHALTVRGRKSRAKSWYPSLVSRILQRDAEGKRPKKGRFAR